MQDETSRPFSFIRYAKGTEMLATLRQISRTQKIYKRDRKITCARKKGMIFYVKQ